MQHPKNLRSKFARLAIIPAALLCVVVSGCADQPATGVELAQVARATDVPLNKFFVAWSQSASTNPVQTQVFALDGHQDRQFVDFYPAQHVLDFARANPGRLYINGDEPDQYCVPPSEYAAMYHDFVVAMRGADPTARLSPAGFAEPNWHCCPLPDDVPAPCWSNSHSIGYADAFYNAYRQRYGAPPPVDEWRFHDFGLAFVVGDMDGWWARVQNEASWSVAHGANMVLGTWGFIGWSEPIGAFQEHMKRAMGLILSDSRIKSAVYWTREPWIYSPHYLQNPDGSLTPEGQTFINPLNDVPVGLTITSSATGDAKLRWSNTTSAWGAEVEFWVQAPGSNSFVYRSTQRVPSLGAIQTPAIGFNAGETVKGRVRYYNALGQAAWSDFSNTVVIASTAADADQRPLFGKRPLRCFLRLC